MCSAHTWYARFESGRAFAPQKNVPFLSSADNVPFGGTSRAKATLYCFSYFIIYLCEKKCKCLKHIFP